MPCPPSRPQPRRILEITAIGRQQVIDVHHHGLAFDDGVARRRTLVVDLIPIAVLALHDRLCPRLAPLCQIIILILQRVREFVREDGSLFFEGHGVQQENGLGLFVVKPGNRLPVRLHQELTQVEVPRQQAELLHREFGACETLGKIGASQTVLGEFFDVFLPHDSFLYRIVLG